MLRVAAYCRVSTSQEDQRNSLENQRRYFSEYISPVSYTHLTLPTIRLV